MDATPGCAFVSAAGPLVALVLWGPAFHLVVDIEFILVRLPVIPITGAALRGPLFESAAIGSTSVVTAANRDSCCGRNKSAQQNN